MKNKVIGIFFLVLLSLNFVVAEPPFQQTTTSGLIIESPIIETIEQNQPFTFNLHVHNYSNGLVRTNISTSCNIHIYNNHGGHLTFSKMEFATDDKDFTYTANANNFTEIGQYAGLFYCNGSTLGGFFEFPFYVTPNGREFTIQNSVSYIGFIVVIFFMFLLSLYGSIKIKWKHNKTSDGQVIGINELRYVKILLFTMDYLLMMFIFGLSYKFFYESGIDGFYNFFYYGYKMFESLLIPILFCTIILWIIVFLSNLKLKKNRELGL